MPRAIPPFPLDRRDFTIRLRMRLPSDRGSIGAAIAPVLGIARRCGCAEGSEADLEIALREALANAIIHGNDYQHFKRIYLRCYGQPDGCLLIMVRDEGEGFVPDKVPDPRNDERLQLDHGRGLFLMRALMDHVEYRKSGREVVLFKLCGPRDS